MSNSSSTIDNTRIIFMGTPEFAVASLDALLSSGFIIAAVVTSPDKPAGRGLKVQESAVKQYAIKKGLPILQPEKLKNPIFLQQLKELRADMQIVVAFRMLPEQVWNMPSMGTINLHGSLLPQYRGAAPINWAIINGEKETGVTTFKLKHDIDTGNILLQEKILIGENQNAGELHDVMMKAGACLLAATVRGLCSESLLEKSQATLEQISQPLKHAPKIFTDTCRINWHHGINDIHNLVRGLSPFPGAFTMLENKMLKVYRSEKIHSSKINSPGTISTDKKTFLHFAANDGYISILELKLEGKRKMNVEEFLRGYRFE